MMDLFTPIFSSLYNSKQPTTNKEIAKQTGLNEHRIALLKKHPERATLAEIEMFAEVFDCLYWIGNPNKSNEPHSGR